MITSQIKKSHSMNAPFSDFKSEKFKNGTLG